MGRVNLGKVWGTSGRSGTGRGTLGRSGTGRGTLVEVQDGSRDRRGGPGRLGDPLGGSG